MDPPPDPRPATPADAEGIAAVQVRAWQAAYVGIVASAHLDAMSIPTRAERWREMLLAVPSAGASSTWVSQRADGAIAGFVSFGRRRDAGAAADDGEIWALYVDPAAWGGGHGRSLLERAVTVLRAQGFATVHLWVLAQNARGIGFYRAAGFEERPDSRQTFELAGQRIGELAMVHRPAP